MFTFREIYITWIPFGDTLEPYHSSYNVNANVKNHKVFLLFLLFQSGRGNLPTAERQTLVCSL